jgi:hypothetical protein
MTESQVEHLGIPSYLDGINPVAWVNFANSLSKVGPVGVRDGGSSTRFTVGYQVDSDVATVMNHGGVVVVASDEETYSGDDYGINTPFGYQTAIINNSARRVVVEPAEGVTVRGPVHLAIPPWKVGVFMKYNANFWLLSLGSGAAGAVATPTAPTLVDAVAGKKSVTLTWTPPDDDGGYVVLGYIAQMSEDGVVWSDVYRGGDGTERSTTIKNLGPGSKSFRVKAFNEVGDGDPSNTLEASPLLPPPEMTHVAKGQFRVTDYDAGNTYSITASDGTQPVIDATGLITGMGANCVITVKYRFMNVDSIPVYGKRLQYTTHRECHDECTPRCGSAYQWVNCDCPGPNCCNGCNNCWGGGVDGSCAADGTICCGGSRGQDCRQVCIDVKNPTPAGMTDSGGEWWQVSETPLTSDAKHADWLPHIPDGVSFAGGELVGGLRLPLSGEPDEEGHVVLNAANATLVFRSGSRVLRYYSDTDGGGDFVASLYPGDAWVMRLHDSGDLSWVPAVGCDWWFRADDLNGDLLVEQTGSLEVTL